MPVPTLQSGNHDIDRPLKLLLCHNYYQKPGGEDRVFEDEAQLLQQHGHQVVRYVQSNDAIEQMSSWEVARRTIWNHRSYRELRELIRRERPDIMHCTNTFSADLAGRLLRGPRRADPGRANLTELSLDLPRFAADAQAAGVRGLHWQGCRLAGRGAWLLSGQPVGHRLRDDDACCSQGDGHLAKSSGSLHRRDQLCASEIRRSRIGSQQDLGKAELRRTRAAVRFR